MKLNQRLTQTVFASAVFAFLAMGSSHVMAKQYYKWVDSKGSTHYTTTPPPKNARSKAKVDTYGYHGGSAPASQPTQSQNAPVSNQQPQQNQPQSQPQNNNVSPAQQQNEQQHKEANQALEKGRVVAN